MREVQSDAYFDAATCGTETSIRLGTAAVDGVTGVSIDYLRSDWIHTLSSNFRPRDALADYLGTPLPEPPHDIRTMAAEVTENLEWSYQIAREIIGFGHRRAESRYNERMVEKQYKPGNLVRVVQHTHLHGVPS